MLLWQCKAVSHVASTPELVGENVAIGWWPLLVNNLEMSTSLPTLLLVVATGGKQPMVGCKKANDN